MKMKNILIIALALTICLTGCGKQKTSSIESENLSAVGQAVTELGESVAVTETASTISRGTENPTSGEAETRLPTEKTENSAKPHTQAEEKTSSNAPVPPNESATQKPKPVEPTKSTTAPTQTALPITPPSTTENPTESPVQELDIDYWIAYAKNYAKSVGLHLDSTATDCWDNPIPANAQCKYLERDIQNRLNRYAKDSDITSVWIWAEKVADNSYEIYIGYA